MSGTEQFLWFAAILIVVSVFAFVLGRNWPR